jgi:peptidoglycan/xylan/chitin deacetylase (PgdA/CDA1 family)
VPQTARERLYEWHPGRARRWRRYPGIQRVKPGGHAVLTFDDGPDEDATPAVLDALDDVGGRATFFLLASQVDVQIEIAREIIDRGHEVGLHGYGHERHDRIPSAGSRDDVLRGHAAIEELVGVQCRWYRPPYGKMAPGSVDACRALGMTPVYWSAWGLDWENVGVARIAEVVCEQLDDGGILLLHDSARYARRPSAVPTARAIPLIATRARERGISLVSLGGAIRMGEALGA